MSKNKKNTLFYKVEMSKKNYGFNKRQLTTLINKSTRKTLLSGDKKAIQKAIRLNVSFKQTGKISNKSIDFFVNNVGRFKNDKKGNIFFVAKGGNINKKSLVSNQLRINKSTLEKLTQFKIINTKQAQTLQSGIKQSKQRNKWEKKGLVAKTKLPQTRQVTDVLDVIKNMGGLITALDMYPDRVSELCEKAGIEIDDLF